MNRHQRILLGIWIGSASDREVAERVGCSRTAVRLERLRLGIPAFYGGDRRRSAARLLRSGGLSYFELGVRLGVSKQTAHRLVNPR